MLRPFCTDQDPGPVLWSTVNDFWTIFIGDSYSERNISSSFSSLSPSSPPTLLELIRPTCSEETIFIWIPSILLLILSVIELCRLSSEKRAIKKAPIYDEFRQPMPITVFYLIKIFLSSLLCLIGFIRVLYWASYADTGGYAGSELTDETFINLSKPETKVVVEWKDSLAPLIGDLILAFSYLYIAILFHFYRRFHFISSFAIFSFLVTQVIVNLYTSAILILEFVPIVLLNLHSSPSSLVSYFSITAQPFMLASKVCHIFLLDFLFVIYCLSDHDAARWKYSPDKSSLRDKMTNPEQFASFLSRITFSWFTELINKARHVGALQQDDLWLLSPKNLAPVVMAPFEQLLRKYRIARNRINIVGIVFRLYWSNLLSIAVIKLISSLFVFVSPIMLDLIIEFVDPNSTQPPWKGYLYASAMFLSPMLESLFTSQYEYHINVISMRIKTCLISAVYNKSLRLSNASRQQFTVGEIVNLIAVDSQRIVDFVNNMNTLWAGPVQIGIGSYLLYRQLSVASFAGLSYMLFVIPINIWLTRKSKQIQTKVMVEKDHRSKLMDEILNAIKVIKLNAWERFFQGNVMDWRNRELKHLRSFAIVGTFMNIFMSSSAFFVSLFSFLAFTLLSENNVLNANRAFVSLALFNIIRIPLAYMPLAISAGALASVSIKRINIYLNSVEIDPTAVNHITKYYESKSALAQTTIKIEHGTFAWSQPDSGSIPVLNDINLEIKKSQLVTIIGGVGAGKTSLLSAILGDIEKLTGNVEVKGKLAYVPQEAWIRNATIRENILLNKAFDEARYRQVLEDCALNFDMAMFADGDMTEVGEKGVNLSGGQKQRISIARAVYSDADIFIFDDPLSALDAHVGRHLFERIIGPDGLLHKKTRVLVTHKISLLPQADQIIFIAGNEIAEMGSFIKLITSNGPFAEYAAEYFLENTAEGTNIPGLPVDELEVAFLNKVQPQIKPAIERIGLSHSLSHSMPRRQISTYSARSLRSHRSIQASILSQLSAKNSTINRSNTILLTAKGRLIQAEGMEEGSVKSVNYSKFIRTIGCGATFFIVVAMVLSNGFQVMGSLWLSEWSNDQLPQNIETNTVERRYCRVVVYALLGVLELSFTFIGTLVIFLSCVRASKVLHNTMLSSIMKAPMSFFDTTPMGRIMNRFSRDIDIIDLQVSQNIRQLLMQILRVLVAFGLIGLEAASIIVLLVPMSVCYYLVQRLYLNTSRQLKRIEAVTRSPLNNNLSETVSGAVSIRTYGLTERFVRDMHKNIDANNRSYWLNFAASRWLSIRLEFLSYTIVFIATIVAVNSRGTLSPGIVGLAISYSLNITTILNAFIRAYTDLETNFVSIERIAEYSGIEPEQPEIAPGKLLKPDTSWPSRGEIVFENYSAQYSTGSQLCLKRLNLTIQSGSKVAIVGRTGSGKTSLSLALFRVLEPIEGTIFIDNVDIRKISLELLRESLTIVPQEPSIFCTTLRDNVDILHQHTDIEIIEALKMANLEQFLESVDYNLSFEFRSPDALSAGQRQLFCLARALLKKRSVIVFDEATSSVDHETDALIHNTIFSEQFQSNTVLMIVHRLDRVMQYDYVLVMDNGNLAEYDTPQRLMADPNGIFSSMMNEAMPNNPPTTTS